MALFDPSTDFTALVAYFSRQVPGSRHSWESIQANTAVEMDERGKTMARRAILKSHPGWLPIPGWGIQIVDASTAKADTGRYIMKGTRALHRAGKHAEQSLEAFGEEMDTHTRQSLQLAKSGADMLKFFARNKLQKALNAPEGTVVVKPLPPMLPEEWLKPQREAEV